MPQRSRNTHFNLHPPSTRKLTDKQKNDKLEKLYTRERCNVGRWDLVGMEELNPSGNYMKTSS